MNNKTTGDAESLRAIRRDLVAQRAQLDTDIAAIDKLLQALCKHDWRLAQVAGEGRVCTKCHAVDYCDD